VPAGLAGDSVPAVDPEFKHLLFRVLAIGGILLTLGTTALLFAFRRLGRATRETEPASFAILIGAAALIIVFCIVLLRMSPQVQ
jgi:hypothetical protein